MNFSSSTLQRFLIISDSHGRCLSPISTTSIYRIENYSISGLQWNNKYDPKLSLFVLLQKDPFFSLLRSTPYVLFLVGTNSVRSLNATEIITQIDEIFTSIYSQNIHLRNQKIIVTTCIPCLKVSRRFSTIVSLMNNIDYYNHLLFTLSKKFNFLILDLQLSNNWLGKDMMHIGDQYRHEFSNILLNYIHCLQVNQDLPQKIIKRSREAISRRNKKRNLKQKNIQKDYTLSREVNSLWSYTHLKYFLKLYGIRYGSLSIASNNILYLRFNNSLHLMHADHALSNNIFDSAHFEQWSRESH